MPLIFTSNEVKVQNVFDWKDITGIQYHYPNVYVNKVKPGEAFIYYRGVRRKGNTRGNPEYFGCGVISEVWRDESISTTAPKSSWQWYCSIEEYIPFNTAVPFKINGIPFENIPPNLWGVGIRSISEETYQNILSDAGIKNEALTEVVYTLPALKEVKLQESTCLLPRAPQSEKSNHRTSNRYSKRAKQIGDRAEELVFEWIKQEVPNNKVRWLAKEGLTPGWDIEFEDENGQTIAVEVKASVGKAFLDFEVTQNELDAAKRLGSHYWFYLVADCFGEAPIIQKISAKELESTLYTTPVRWRVALTPT